MVRRLSSLPPTFPLLTALTVAPWARSDAKYESLDKSAQGRYKDLEKKSASALSKAEKDAANTEAKLKKEAAAAAVMEATAQDEEMKLAEQTAAEVKRRFTERSLLLCGSEFLATRRCIDAGSRRQHGLRRGN